MKIKHVEKFGFKYLTAGKGNPIIILHGLMGGLGNFEFYFSFSKSWIQSHYA